MVQRHPTLLNIDEVYIGAAICPIPKQVLKNPADKLFTSYDWPGYSFSTESVISGKPCISATGTKSPAKAYPNAIMRTDSFMLNSYEGPHMKKAIDANVKADIIITRRSIHFGKRSMAKLPGIENAGIIIKKYPT